MPEDSQEIDINPPMQNCSSHLNNQGIAMFLRLENLYFPAISSSLQVKDMRNHLKEWSIPLIHGFKLVPKITEIYTMKHQPVSDVKEKIYHYSGFINGHAVCSLSLSLCGNKARLDDIATIPTLQRKGYATQLIYVALQQAQQRNARYCFLDASPTALTLYKKIGFIPLYIHRYYI